MFFSVFAGAQDNWTLEISSSAMTSTILTAPCTNKYTAPKITASLTRSVTLS